MHLLPCRPRPQNCCTWRWFYNSRNIWQHQMASWRAVEEVEMCGTWYFRTTRNTKHHPRHQSPEQNYHMEGEWNLVGTRCTSCRVGDWFTRRWSPRSQSQDTTGRPQERHCFSQWWRSNPVQISCNASSLFGTRSTRSASSDKIFSTRATTTNYQPHAHAQTSCTIPKVSTTHGTILSSSEQTQSICDVVWCWPRWLREDEEERVRRRPDGRRLLYQDLL